MSWASVHSQPVETSSKWSPLQHPPREGARPQRGKSCPRPLCRRAILTPGLRMRKHRLRELSLPTHFPNCSPPIHTDISDVIEPKQSSGVPPHTSSLKPSHSENGAHISQSAQSSAVLLDFSLLLTLTPPLQPISQSCRVKSILCHHFHCYPRGQSIFPPA